MKFDQTFIAIRERSILEIADLALHVLLDHFRPLFWLLVIGVLPWAVLDYFLVGWLHDSPETGRGFYYWVMAVLIISQAQIGTTFMTRYLGQAMFEGRPGIWGTVKDTCKTSIYFLWSHIGIRCIGLILLCSYWLSDDLDWTLIVSAVFLPGILGTALLIRSFRPFVSEILLLERTPISSQDQNQIHFGKRTKSLHGSAASDLFGRWMTIGFFALPLTFTCFAFFVVIDSALNLRANSETTLYPFYWMAACWMVAGYVSIVRFLSYIDIRIRQEGWAVELRMRAEGQRLQKAME